jgi:ATP-dependent DNA helicase RecQ
MNRAGAEALLKKMLGSETTFRPGQWEAIDCVANHRQRLLVVQRTGWGKSVVYFLATKILREAGAGPTLLISPLLSLMRNQTLAADRLGVRALAMHTENHEDWAEVIESLEKNSCDLLMVSPERLGNREFLDNVLPKFQGTIGLFVVDEAHCISDWGHDFRPDYRRIVRLLRLLPPGVPVLCTTATANDRVVEDVLKQIPRLEMYRGSLVRQSLRLYNIKLADQAERLAWLAAFLSQLPGSGIIYCLTIPDTERVARWLQQKGIPAEPYHAQLGAAARVQAENQLLKNEIKALVATVALGMGFDKPDLGFVIHFQRPGSAVAYYQQVGRAGRAVDKAYGILLNGKEDDDIAEYFIDTAFPEAEVMEDVVSELEKDETMTIEHLGARLNLSRSKLEKALRLLEVDGAVQHERKGYSRTANPWASDTLRAEEVTAKRRRELEQIAEYVEHTGCLMQFLARALDDPHPTPCGKCMNCTGQQKRQPPPMELVRDAIQFLRGHHLLLEPKSRWPQALLPQLEKAGLVELSEKGVPKSTLPPHLRPEPGAILCAYGDAGWGQDVARGKYQTAHFGSELVEATATLVREKWSDDHAPQWITAMPSLEHDVVAQFGAELAAALGMPFVKALRKVRATAPQKQMENSFQQLKNLLGAIEVVGKVNRGPVLLIDDIVDSGWTLTLGAVLLRKAGSGPVYPFALAKATPVVTS